MFLLLPIFIGFIQAVVIDKTLNGLDQYNEEVIKHIRKYLVEPPPKYPENIETIDLTSYGQYDYGALHGKTFYFQIN